jgi:hypothetical protein
MPGILGEVEQFVSRPVVIHILAVLRRDGRKLLMELALWWWVVFVLWATRPNYD